MGCFTGNGGGGSVLPDRGQSQWSAAASGHQGGVCLHTAQLERGLLSHSPEISFHHPRSKIRAHIVFVLSVIMSFCNSVLNINLANNF